MERMKKLFMITRYNRKWTKPEKVSCPIREEYEFIVKLEPISFNEDKTIKEYKEVQSYNVRKTKWHDFIKSFDLGTISEQVMNHLTKGTPLVTAHTLPAGDYTPETLEKGASIRREMSEKGITLDMLVEAFKKANEKIVASDSVKESEVVSNG